MAAAICIVGSPAACVVAAVVVGAAGGISSRFKATARTLVPNRRRSNMRGMRNWTRLEKVVVGVIILSLFAFVVLRSAMMTP